MPAGIFTFALPSASTVTVIDAFGGSCTSRVAPALSPVVVMVTVSPSFGGFGVKSIVAVLVPMNRHNSNALRVFPMRPASTFLVLLLCLLCSSCGTMLGGGPWMVPVSSNPAGATVYYDGSPVGRTPCQVAMHGHNLELRLELEGHSTANVEVDTSINWWGGLNGVFLIPGILIGTTVDFINGNHHRVSTEPVYVSLQQIRRRQPQEAAAAPASAPPGGAAPIDGNPFGPVQPIRMGITPGTRPWLEDDLNTPELPQPSALPPAPPAPQVPPPPGQPRR